MHYAEHAIKLLCFAYSLQKNLITRFYRSLGQTGKGGVVIFN